MSLPYKINPVKATCMKFQSNENNLVGVNDTCFGICSAFSGSINTYDMDKKCTEACDAFVERRKREIYGVGRCDHQAPYRPVIWEQYPRYVPRLIKQGMNPDVARGECMRLCDVNNPLVASECKDTCILDRNAVEYYDVKEVNNKPNEEKPSENKYEIKPIEVLITLMIIFVIIMVLRKFIV